MKKKFLDRILENGRAFYLAYDQGLEHGPEGDFNDENIDPLFILKIAKKEKYGAVVFHKGIAEKYQKEIKKSKIPLILKLNGKTRLADGEPISAQIATVDEAKKLGAVAVGFTIYIGSKFEAKMVEEFSEIEREAHEIGMPVIVWIYPRGGKVKNDVSREMMAYAARTALELGADMVKMKWGGNKDDLRWAVKSAGRCKVVVAGGNKKSEKEFLKEVKDVMDSGAIGMAVGRNVWQSEDAFGISKKIREIIFG